MFVYKGVVFFFEGVQNSACSLSDYICGVEKYLNFVCVRLRPHACVCVNCWQLRLAVTKNLWEIKTVEYLNDLSLNCKVLGANITVFVC